MAKRAYHLAHPTFFAGRIGATSSPATPPTPPNDVVAVGPPHATSSHIGAMALCGGTWLRALPLLLERRSRQARCGYKDRVPVAAPAPAVQRLSPCASNI